MAVRTASEQHGGDLCATDPADLSEPTDPLLAPPRRPTSHRRTGAADADADAIADPARGRQRPVSLRSSAILALVTGLAITSALMLRVPRHEIALGPDRAFPESPSSPDVSSAAAAASPGDRSATPVSRDGDRPPAAAPDSDFEAQVVALTNAQRTSHGCPALRSDNRLHLAAIAHSVDMQSRGYFAHDTPDGVTPWTRMSQRGYPDASAENIAMGQISPQAVVDAWMNSPGHRANILNCSSKAVGVGVRLGPGGPWWTEDFGYS